MASYLKSKECLLHTQAFLYKWTHIPTGKWYVGSRTAKGCHPNDGYICSSVGVKSSILENKSEWHRDVLVIGDSEYIFDLETKFLKEVDAKNDEMSFNMHNGDGKFTTLGRIESASDKEKRASKLRGIKKLVGFGDKIRKLRTGLKFNDVWRQNIGKASTGRVQNSDAREKNSKANSGEKNPSFKGYYISPNNEVFDSSYKAGEKFNVTRHTIVTWAKHNKNGWSFVPKELIK